MDTELIEIYDGGLATLFTSDPDYDESEGRIHAPLAGIADMLADHGRYEDVYMVHAAEGETVVPMEIFERNPTLKAMLWEEMQAMGIEPERYVVGNQLNSINPVTGQPEFFLKKLFKGVGKAIKGVVKVLKKAAPVILPIALNLIPGVGPILAGAAGSGIGTLIKGGDLKDALKAAAIGGITGGIAKGIGGITKGVGGAAGKAGAETAAKGTAEQVAKEAAFQASANSAGQGTAQAAAQGASQNITAKVAENAAASGGLAHVAPETLSSAAQTSSAGFLDQVKEFVTPGADGKGLLKNTGDFLNPFNKGPSTAAIDSRTAELVAEGFTKDKAYEIAMQELTPSTLQKWGPLAGVGLGAMALGGGFEAPEVEAQDPWAAERSFVTANPERYRIGTPNYPMYQQPQDNGIASIFGSAAGYMDGGPVNGPGTETSDDVPAWLSDGEFVFTARAVRGAGGGDRKKGVKTLASLMQNMEARA